MGERAYELRKNWFGGPQAFAAGLFVVFAVIEALNHEVTTSWILVGFAVLSGGMAAYWLLLKPYRIVLADAGVRMVSRVRPVVVVPWSKLDSVNVEWGRFGASLDWQYVDGRGMATSGLFADLHHIVRARVAESSEESASEP
jgi:hypothetical protein